MTASIPPRPHDDARPAGGYDVHVLVAPVLAASCVVVAARTPGPDGRRDCVVVDAGAGVGPAVVDLVDRRGLAPRAVLATHGHADHTWDAPALAERYGVPVVVHAEDAYRLADPVGTIEGRGPTGVLGPVGQALRAAGADDAAYRPPADVRTVEARGEDAVVLRYGDVTLRALHAPGHTQGSTLYLVGEPGDGVVLSGDVLFAGAVGRTDLAGGDGPTMARTLRDVVGRLDPRWDVLPGHGPATTVARELRSNPYLTS